MGKRKTEKILKREFSAGGVVYRPADETWLIIKPRGVDRWQLPKGLINKNESSAKAALREVGEEGGIKAQIIERLGNQRYFYVWKGAKIFKNVDFYLMQYLAKKKGGHDQEIDEAIFLPFKEALNRLTFKNDKEFLARGKKFLGQIKKKI